VAIPGTLCGIIIEVTVLINKQLDMKNLLIALLFFGIISCNFNTNQNNIEDNPLATIDCARTIDFGDIQICLPEIDGMTECLSEPIVSLYNKTIKSPDELTIALYLNDLTYKNRDALFVMQIDDFFKIFSTDFFKNQKAGRKELEYMAQQSSGGFITVNWDEFKDQFKEMLPHLSPDRPVIIENYSPHNDVRTIVQLWKYRTEYEEFVSVTIFNIMLLKSRLVFMTYANRYENHGTISQTKAKNDYIIHRLVQANK